MSELLFRPFGKIGRWSRDIVITEKLDGTNASVYISPASQGPVVPGNVVAVSADGLWWLRAGARTRWITPDDDNFGFAGWAESNAEELFKLGEGHHFGEWWGNGIQRKYGLAEKRFSLFNTHRWTAPEARPACCHVVPTLYTGPNEEYEIHRALDALSMEGSVAAPGFYDPEGIVIFHTATGALFKKTLVKDEAPKSRVAQPLARAA